jgi:excisionase family DNA binding protein
MTLPFTPPRASHNQQLVFTSSQAAGYLGISLATIRRWTDAGHISCYRTPGGQRRFSRDQLEDFVSSMHREGPARQEGQSRREGPVRRTDFGPHPPATVR